MGEVEPYRTCAAPTDGSQRMAYLQSPAKAIAVVGRWGIAVGYRRIVVGIDQGIIAEMVP